MVRRELDGHGRGVGAGAGPAGLTAKSQGEESRQPQASKKGIARGATHHFNRHKMVGGGARFPLQNWKGSANGEGLAGVFVTQGMVAAE